MSMKYQRIFRLDEKKGPPRFYVDGSQQVSEGRKIDIRIRNWMHEWL